MQHYGYRIQFRVYIVDTLNIHFPILHEHISLYNEHAASSLRETN